MIDAGTAPPPVARSRRLAAAALLAATLLLTACAGFQKPAPDADYGAPPSSYKDAARAHVELNYDIPAGSTFEVGEPVRAYMNNGLALGGEVAWLGYVVDVAVSSPEAAGGVGDPKPYTVYFRDGRVTHTLDLAEHPLVTRVD